MACHVCSYGEVKKLLLVFVYILPTGNFGIQKILGLKSNTKKHYTYLICTPDLLRNREIVIDRQSS